MENNVKLSFGLKLLFIFGILCIGMGIAKLVKTFTPNETLGCKEIQSWKSEADIIKSLQGTWEMDHDEYYGKRRFQFSGRSGKSWIMRKGSNRWEDDGVINFEYYKTYEHNTQRNYGTEYYISYDAELGSISFEADCIIGLGTTAGGVEHGMTMHKID
ncbi:hypothetical protein FMM05_20150 [Flavobacterium zepuense]|uniref:Uncharacterized protein n=1 Tax=Flavobacterium zepuense TaxID=2593302 RepID=A0A552UTB4_9FLAO|nr:hypothetical protein [Flavobacterium zepuense]TRW21465.1 hypothetical protein FMM05_20150 [Flavobacterium zepuense]